MPVNLTFGEAVSESGTAKPSVINTAESEQKIPKEARKAFNLGVKFKKDDPAQAEINFSRAVELFPEYFQAFSERGDLNVLRHNLDAAARDFDQALKFNPRYGPALRGSGYCKLSAGEHQ